MRTTRPVAGLSFTRRSSTRLLSGVASIGVLAGMSLFAAAPAHAAVGATDADCVAGIGGNIVDAGAGGTGTDIQTLLTAGRPVICLAGTFTISTRLSVSSTVAFHGFPSAELVGDNSQIIIVGNPVPISIENLRIAGGRYAGGGAAIQSYGTTVRNSTFEDNRSTSAGGAIFARGPVDIEGSTFDGNQAPDGSAIFMGSSDTVRVVDSVFRDNVGSSFPAAIVAYGVTTVSGSTFEDNTGGALDLRDTSTVTNSTFVGNTGQNAVYAQSATVSNSTFLDNPEGAVQGTSATTVRGNIFASSGVQVPQIDSNSSTAEVVDGGGNVFTTASTDEYALAAPIVSTRFGATVAALFTTGVLADNGGPTPTLALNPSGPAIDAFATGAATDQRGEARVGLADAGSFEYIAPAAPPVVTPAAPTLPPTGAESGALAGLAGALLAAGALVLTALRRQRRA